MSEGWDHAPQRVIGRYALYGEIAAGGMATVHVGRLLGPVGFSRTVAIKRLHPQYAKDPEFVSMFLDEARVAARIQHPNVVSTLDVVALEGELFLVMEYVEGESLARVLRVLRADNQRMPPKIVGSIVCNMLYGLHAAHEAKSERGEPLGIVHRDVSPQNVLVGVDGVSRVLDFGVAKAAGRVQTTREGQVKGKLAYMPPEQLAGDKVDRRLDVYAAAVVLWESLTSTRLFDGDNDGVVLQRVLTSTVQRPSELVEGLPPGLDEIVLRGLARNPDKRYQTAREMAVDLEDVLGVDPPRKVGDFVERCVGDQIAKRAARIKEIESISSDPSGAIDTPLPGFLAQRASAAAIAAAPSSTPGLVAPPSAPQVIEGSSMTRLSSVSNPLGRERKNRKGIWAALLLLSIGTGIPILIFFLRPRTQAVDAAAGDNTTGAATSDVGSRPTDAPKATAPPPAESAKPTSSAATDASAAASAKTQRPAANHPPPQLPPAQPPKPKPNCTPPYVIEDGIRKLKPECVN